MNGFYWNALRIEFVQGETVALALRRAGVANFGPTPNGGAARYFCGIGQCQGCLVSIDGSAPVESCITPAKADSKVTSGY
ncbi:2Fe-2S iron-sulfur cluster-binding protein [Trinickia dinghuensis]|uniref:(2Fe-2S)-binding protein n=1 Tax=Trinickia dinghuensis TaxID=2291023 RepID=A0A3D8JXM3_9BURK|nr:2Fe-2S iron-sulfur cluster-binding protein [Trinickia dinghuensis]RDU97404.1 (2Fe-2S)-binding protein [Trinickia dinghuensis]